MSALTADVGVGAGRVRRCPGRAAGHDARDWRTAIVTVVTGALVVGACAPAQAPGGSPIVLGTATLQTAAPRGGLTGGSSDAAGTRIPEGAGYGKPEQLVAEVLASHPHDPDAYTQGLLWADGQLFESTGRYGASTLRRVDLESGRVAQQVDLPADRFGEGLALVDNRLIQLTWRQREAIVYDRYSFERLGAHPYDTEGWGLCFDGERLILSDGSPSLFFHDRDTFELVGRVSVSLEGAPLANLNELECVGDHVYANIWMADTIVRIGRATGRVEAVVDAWGLLPHAERQAAEALNGIAYKPETDTFLLTGKLWPKLLEVRFVPAAGS